MSRAALALVAATVVGFLLETPAGARGGLPSAEDVSRGVRCAAQQCVVSRGLRACLVREGKALLKSMDPRLAPTGGVVLAAVAPGSVAAALGLLPGDQIVTVSMVLLDGAAHRAEARRVLETSDHLVIGYERAGVRNAIEVIVR